jgi:hypothetical protein
MSYLYMIMPYLYTSMSGVFLRAEHVVLSLYTMHSEKIKISVDFEKNKEIRVNQKCMSLKLLACHRCDFKHGSSIACL